MIVGGDCGRVGRPRPPTGENCNRYGGLIQLLSPRSATLRDLFGTGLTALSAMDTQSIKNEMAALRERFNALRGYL
jgi:hypothetical protein